MAAFIVFYDANVLYPAELRNFLMHLALIGVFRAKWSAEVHEEWIGSLLENRPDLSRAQLERTRQLMDKALPDALVIGGFLRLARWFSAASTTNAGCPKELRIPKENSRSVLLFEQQIDAIQNIRSSPILKGLPKRKGLAFFGDVPGSTNVSGE
ncbi:MAG: hypothetical protein ABI147_11165 [Acidobacteriaceae bacterium]